MTGAFRPDDLARTEREVQQALATLRLPASAARLWLSSAAGRLDCDAEWALEYDADLELATFEVRLDERLVFGLDDWLPQVQAPSASE